VTITGLASDWQMTDPDPRQQKQPFLCNSDDANSAHALGLVLITHDATTH